MSGKFIAFEGPDGCGKSTQVGLVAAELKKRGHSVVTTRQPGGCAVGQVIRGILKDVHLQQQTPALARRLLFGIDEICHAAEIKSWLQHSDFVLIDRVAGISNAAYGAAEGTSPDEIRAVEAFGRQVRLIPDLTVLLMVPVEIGWGRQDGSALDPAEQDRRLFERVHLRYDEMANHVYEHGDVRSLSGDRYPATVVWSDRPKEDVTRTIVHEITSHMS